MNRWSVAFILFQLLGVTAGPIASAAPPGVQTPTTLEHLGICDASTAVAIGSDEFLVANDECVHRVESDDCNQLLVYKSKASGRALKGIDITEFMALKKKNKEADLEGSAALGERVYWITSHARSKDGEIKENRQRLFALEIRGTGGQVTLKAVGRPYTNLLKDLLADERFQSLTEERLKPQADPNLAAEKEGAVNIEGLAAFPGDQLLIGFRNPIAKGKAVLVPLENPGALLSGKDRRAKLGEPILLDLGGRGIRSIELWKERSLYLIVGGPMGKPAPAAEKPFLLYQWTGSRSEPPREIAEADLTGLNPEALVVYPGLRDRFQVLSDDGEEQRGGM